MSKISELSDGGALQSTDYLIAVRSGGNVKVQLSELPSGIGAGGNIVFGDNEKAIFGAGSDLEIYHSGTHSIINETGTGELKIQATNLRLQSASGGENYLTADLNGAVRIYYDDAQKFQTTSTGIDVTGTVTADGLTVDGNVDVQSASTASLSLINTDTILSEGQITGAIDFYQSDSTSGGTGISAKIETESVQQTGAGSYYGTAADLNIRVSSGGAANNADLKAATFHHGGDISFYEDTGTTPKFFWDASAERLGVGTATPNAPVDAQLSGVGGLPVSSGTAQTYGSLRVGATSFNTILDMGTAGGTGAWLQASDRTGLGTNYSLLLNPNGGNVGIGTGSPTDKLHVSGTASVFKQQNNVTNWTLGLDAADQSYKIKHNGSERMRIDASGNVGIGTTSPNYKLETKDGDIAVVKLEAAAGGNTVNGIRFRVNNSANTAESATLGMVNAETVNSWGGVLTFSTKPANGTPNESVTERMRIDSSGNVGIGTTSPNAPLHIANAAPYIRLEDTSASVSHYINSSNTELRVQADSVLSLRTSGVEAARIDSSGNLLVGKASAGFANTGHQLNGNGSYAAFTRDGATPVLVNRKTSDGAIVEYMKDGTAVGSIGVSGGNNIYISGTVTSHSGLTFATGEILPSAEGAITNGQESLGSSSNRFKDLYLSGGVYLGGTGAANLLDDYETGNWTPVLTGTGYSFGTHTGTYVKVGRMVYVCALLNITTVGTNTSLVTISGYPFTADSPANQHQIGVVRQSDTTGRMYVGQISSNTTQGSINSMDGITSGDNEIFTTGFYSLSLTYMTA